MAFFNFTDQEVTDDILVGDMFRIFGACQSELIFRKSEAEDWNSQLRECLSQNTTLCVNEDNSAIIDDLPDSNTSGCTLASMSVFLSFVAMLAWL